MALVNASWNTTSTVTMAGDADVGAIFSELWDGPVLIGTHSGLAIGANTDQFNGVAAGKTYTQKVYRKDTAGNVIGAVQSASILVPLPPVQVPVPGGLVLSLG
jgi:hypothetical protein